MKNFCSSFSFLIINHCQIYPEKKLGEKMDNEIMNVDIKSYKTKTTRKVILYPNAWNK